jgi:hypothetical protein
VAHGKAFAKLIRGVGDVPARELTPEAVEAWRDEMSHTEKLKPGTVNNYLRWIGTFYNWLVDEKVLEESPVAQVPYIKTKDASAARAVAMYQRVGSPVDRAAMDKGRGGSSPPRLTVAAARPQLQLRWVVLRPTAAHSRGDTRAQLLDFARSMD